MENKDTKEWIDAASYKELLKKWRFTPANDPYFENDIAKYLCEVMKQKGESLDPLEREKIGESVSFPWPQPKRVK